MIKNVPNPKSLVKKSKDFEFAPEYIPAADADEYIRQIRETTEYFADYCGSSEEIETSIILHNSEGPYVHSFFTKVIK